VAHALNSALAGWLVVVPRRHVTALDHLAEEEIVELGPMLRRLTSALRAAVGCEKTYVMLFAEQQGFAHLHLHVVPRMADLPDEHRGPRVLHLLEQPEEAWIGQAAKDDLAGELQQLLGESGTGGRLYPEVEPFEVGLLEVSDGNRLYFEVCGNPEGKPAVVLHGGPGSGCSTDMRRWFDPGAYRVVLFDQRGSGRSTPSASDPTTDLSTNTTQHLLADLEVLRESLGIGSWTVLGVSWGSTLALAYAEEHRERVSELILVGVTTGRSYALQWLYRGAAPLLPDAWSRFVAGVPVAEREGNLIEAYGRLLQHPDLAVREKAARDWTEWEWALSSTQPLHGRWGEPGFQYGRARIVTHYFRHDCWLEDGLLLRRAGVLVDVPGIMIHGRHDASSLMMASELARAWPQASWVIVDGAGHSTDEPGMNRAIVAATDEFAFHGWRH
jgi:proline iminopeptidase